MMRVVRHKFAVYKKHYKSLFNSVLVRAPGVSFYSHLDLNIKDYKRYTYSEFNKLSEKDKRIELHKFMKYISAKLGIASEILFKIAVVESTLNPSVYNRYTGATGLLQIKPILFKELVKRVDFKGLFGKTPRFSDLKDPYVNIVFGAIYLKYCLINLGDYSSALVAYNIGFDTFVKKYKTTGRLHEVAKRYLDKINKVDVNQWLGRDW